MISTSFLAPVIFKPKPRQRQNSERNSEWKGILMLVTLISLYYHGSYLIISCFFLSNGCSAASARVVSSVAAEFHNGTMQMLYNEDENDKRQGQNDLYLQNHRDDQRQWQSPQSPQANDTLANPSWSQGRIHDYLNYDFRNKVISGEVGSVTATVGLNNDMSLRHSQSLGTQSNQRVTNSLSSSASQQPAIFCKDESGNNVDWFIAYKLPQLSSSDPLIKQGSKYFYLLPNAKSWKESTFPINDNNNSILAKSLEFFWSKHVKETARFLYNDQPPSKPAVIMNGHTKGIVASLAGGGIWLQHSCPHFADVTAKNFSSSYPTGGLINGQLFFCMSLANAAEVDKIGSMLQYTRAHIYNFSVPAALEPLLPQLTKDAKKNETVKKAPWFNKYSMNAGDLQLQIFAKGPKFRKEIYSAWIAPELETGFDVQSWLNGPHPIASNCTSNVDPVFNVLMKNLGGQNFSYTDDHSKWAVSLNETKPVTCVGDLNRMKPQKTRGGVAICFNNSDVWSAFKSLVMETQPCNSLALHAKVITKRKRMKGVKHRPASW